jgi:hypothetical protein
MPHITSEQVDEKRNAIRAAFPNWRFSIRRHHRSTIVVVILEAPIDLLEGSTGYKSVNQYYIHDHYKDNEEVKQALQKIKDIANGGNRIVSEDGDYGSIPAFYLDLSIGDYSKAFKYRPELKEKTCYPTGEGVSAKILYNLDKGGIEIKFSDMPAESVLGELRSNGFHFHKYRKVWYKKRTEEADKFANELIEKVNATVTEKVNND